MPSVVVTCQTLQSDSIKCCSDSQSTSTQTRVARIDAAFCQRHKDCSTEVKIGLNRTTFRQTTLLLDMSHQLSAVLTIDPTPAHRIMTLLVVTQKFSRIVCTFCQQSPPVNPSEPDIASLEVAFFRRIYHWVYTCCPDIVFSSVAFTTIGPIPAKRVMALVLFAHYP